jgi:hypothetical protein
MFNNNQIKNYQDTKEIQREIDYEKRLCNLYGICGQDKVGMGSHHVSHFGLKKLNGHKA